MFYSLVIVFKLRVEDRGNERWGGPVAEFGSGLVSGGVVGFLVEMEMMRGAATNGGATLDKWTHVAGSDDTWGTATWGQTAWLFPLCKRNNTDFFRLKIKIGVSTIKVKIKDFLDVLQSKCFT